MGTRFSKSRTIKANVKASSKNAEHSPLLCSPCLSVQICLGFKQHTEKSKTSWNSSSSNSKVNQTVIVQDINSLDSQMNNSKVSQPVPHKEIDKTDCSFVSDQVFNSKFKALGATQPSSAEVSCYLHASSNMHDDVIKPVANLTRFNSETDEKSCEENTVNDAQSNVTANPSSFDSEDLSKQNYFAKNENFNGSLAEIEESKNQILIDGESGEAIVSLSSLEISEKTKDELKLKNISRNDKENQERKLQVVNKFKKLVEKETSILNQLVDKWNELLTDTTIPEEICDEIRAVIGKTKLIISQRFTQFIKLVNKAEDDSNKTIARPVFESDLDGFWEMDYIQVKEVKESFEKLTLRKVNNWKPDEVKAAKSIGNKKKSKKVPALKSISITPEVEARRKEASEKRKKAMQEMRLKKKKLLMKKRNDEVFLQFNHHQVDRVTEQKSELTINKNIVVVDSNAINKKSKNEEVISSSTLADNNVKTGLPEDLHKNLLKSPTGFEVIDDVIVSSDFLPTCNETASNDIPLTSTNNIPIPQTAIVG